jgi:hypothetical protein
MVIDLLQAMLELTLAPCLVAVCTLAGRRWGTGVGGLLSAFPVIVGPVLLITADRHGSAFAARAANGTLLGLVTLSGFVLAYGRLAPHVGWRPSLAGGWACAALLALGIGLGARGLGSPGGVAAAAISLLLAHRALPPAGGELADLLPSTPPSRPVAGRTAAGGEPPVFARGDVPIRMALTTVLVAALVVAASRLGPVLGGVLAALPVLASVLAVFTHRQHGWVAVRVLLRGMLMGMVGFVAFCEIVAVLVVPAGIAPAFAGALLAALFAQALTAHARMRFAS